MSDQMEQRRLERWSSVLVCVLAALGLAYVVAGMVVGAPRTFDRGTSSVGSVALQEVLGAATVACLLAAFVFGTRRLPKAISALAASVLMVTIWLLALLAERAS